jgi:hypothetical protein
MMRSPTLWTWAVTAAMLLAAGASEAAFTTDKCLAAKARAAGVLQKCRTVAEAKLLEGKSADVAKCRTTFASKLAKLDAKAAKKSLLCRFRDNGDGTVTDYDTGLQWEKKNSPDGVAYDPNPHDIDNRYSWSTLPDGIANGKVFTEFLARLNGSTTQFFDVAPCIAADPTAVNGGFAGRCDWRLPTVVELEGLVDLTAPGCVTGGPCLAPAFGGVSGGAYLTSTSQAGNLANVWYVVFVNPFVSVDNKVDDNYAIAVRGGW